MKTMKLALKAELTSRGGATAFLKSPGDAVLILRETPRWLLLKCPCGCGEEIPVNVDKRAGKAWRFYRAADNSVTLYPSVWRDTGCQSHFIIWRDRILMFGEGQASGANGIVNRDIESLCRSVFAAWPIAGFASFVDIADALDEIPYDVQEACELLARAGRLVQGLGKQRGMFRRP